MNWYRIELSEDGALLGCTLITARRVASRLIYFVSAQTEEEAIEKLLERRKKRLETRRRDERAFRDGCAVSGMCTACGKAPPTPGYARCVPCRAYAAAHMQKQRDGLITKPHPRTREEEIASELFQEGNRKARHREWLDKTKEQRDRQRGYDTARKEREHRKLADLGGTGTLRTWRARAALTMQLLELFDSMAPDEFRGRLERLAIDCHAKGDMEPPALATLKVSHATPAPRLLHAVRFSAGRKAASQ